MDFSRPHQDVLEYWFGDWQACWPDKTRARRWFLSNAAQDREINDYFGDRVASALARELVDWEREAPSRLALILLLDQFTRNIFRGTARAFDGDHRAATLTIEGLSMGMDRRLPWVGQVFFYMPLMHAEDIDLQRRGEHCYQDLHDRVPEPLKANIAKNLQFAVEHRLIIERFGRFPHRNRALDRDSTSEELAFLEQGKRYGQ